MMMQEFTKRTGFEPTVSEYAEIEEAYYAFDGDKDAFCKHWMEDGGILEVCKARGNRIRSLENQLADANQKIADSENQLAVLNQKLEAEQEWKPYRMNMSQPDYENLVHCSDTRELSEEEAKNLIYREFGFAREKVTILTDVDEYQVNRHHLLRKVNTYRRMPLYNATDWNYIRFDCAGFQYEMVNGNLLS